MHWFQRIELEDVRLFRWWFFLSLTFVLDSFSARVCRTHINLIFLLRHRQKLIKDFFFVFFLRWEDLEGTLRNRLDDLCWQQAIELQGDNGIENWGEVNSFSYCLLDLIEPFCFAKVSRENWWKKNFKWAFSLLLQKNFLLDLDVLGDRCIDVARVLLTEERTTKVAWLNY